MSHHWRTAVGEVAGVVVRLHHVYVSHEPGHIFLRLFA